MAAPVFQAAGTSQEAGAAAITVAWPTHAVGDIALLVVESGSDVGLGTANGFVRIPNIPQTTTSPITVLDVYWCRATSTSMASPVTNASINHIYGVILTFRGCIATGNPWDVTSGGISNTNDAALSATGATTLLPECLVVVAAARGTDFATAQYSGEACTGLTSLTERHDAGTAIGNGGGFAVWTGKRATAGAYGPLTATLANNATDAFVTIALKPSPGSEFVVVSAGADDGSIIGAAFDNSSTTVAVGFATPDSREVYLRFANVTIPAGATIISAAFTVEATALVGTATNILTKISAEAADSPAAPTTSADFNGRTRTTAGVDWDPATWAVGFQTSPDLTAVIQEVVDRAGWASGNALQILWDDDGTPNSNRLIFAAFDHATAQEAQLVVAYTSGGATGTVAVTQDAQTSTASGTETFTAASAQTQDAQTSTASGSVANPVTGTVAQTQADQTSTASGAETITGTSANVQADQTSTAAGTVGAAPITGTATPTQADQTSTASGFSALNLTGTVAVTQADQTSTATAVETFTGTLAETQDDQTSTATATFGFTGTVGVTQDNQTSTASGISAVTVTGTVAVTQQDQFSTATANGGTVTFWVSQPAGYVFDPVAYVPDPAAYVKVGSDSIPPAW